MIERGVRREDARAPATGRIPRGMMLAALLLLSIACWRITRGWQFYGVTTDEPAHLAAGLEVLSRGTYTYELQHPPISRVAVALGPWLAGRRTVGLTGIYDEGHAILGDARHRETLTLARSGVLPFFVGLVIACWVFARQLAPDPRAALVTTLAVTAPPSLLAHAGLATTDVPFTACFVATILTFMRWLEQPASWRRACLFGAAAGAAIGTKFSALPFFAIGGGGMALLAMIAAWQGGITWPRGREWRAVLVATAGASVVTVLVCWAVYGFQFGPARGVPVPAPDLLRGLRDVARHNREGHVSYFMGETYRLGRAAFFPVGFAVKAPVPFMLLGALAAWHAVEVWRRVRSPWPAMPLLAAAGIMLFSLFARINIGTRHVLPVYPLVAIAIGPAVVALWEERPRLRVVVIGLLAWLVVNTATAWRDPFPWFNAFAGREPARVLVDSDLDWGQDVERLAAAARVRGLEDSLDVLVHGMRPRAERLMPRAHFLEPGDTPSRRYFAISESWLWRGSVSWGRDGELFIQPGFYRWLLAASPPLRVGRSIRVYDLRDPALERRSERP
jgi:hypothetical protein